MTNETFDLGLLVPLAEEFDWIKEVFHVVDERTIDGEYYFVLSIQDSKRLIIARVIDQMGLVTAAVAADRLCTRFNFPILALVGMAGSLDNDILLGDVVVAEQVVHYLHAAKVESNADGAGVSPAGMTWAAPSGILESVRNFQRRPQTSALCEKWRSFCAQCLIAGKLDRAPQEWFHSRPRLWVVPMASGDIVGASSEFGMSLRRHNRKLGALEMEAAGAAASTHNHLRPVPLIVIRGISDFSNERKAELEAGATDRESWSKSAWRRYATLSAAKFLASWCQSPDFPPVPRTVQEILPTQRVRGPSASSDSHDADADESLDDLGASLALEVTQRAGKVWDVVRAFRSNASQQNMLHMLRQGADLNAIDAGGIIVRLISGMLFIRVSWTDGLKFLVELNSSKSIGSATWSDGTSARVVLADLRDAVSRNGYSDAISALDETIFNEILLAVRIGFEARLGDVPEDMRRTVERRASSDLSPIVEVVNEQWAVTTSPFKVTFPAISPAIARSTRADSRHAESSSARASWVRADGA